MAHDLIRERSYAKEKPMVTAFVLVKAQRRAVNETAEALLRVDGIAEVHSCAGEHDLVAVIRIKTHEELADVVTNRMLKLEGIEGTSTLVAIKSISKYDLDALAG
jgi:DNA-binding Lrp family transcriptional regulator